MVSIHFYYDFEFCDIWREAADGNGRRAEVEGERAAGRKTGARGGKYLLRDLANRFKERFGSVWPPITNKYHTKAGNE